MFCIIIISCGQVGAPVTKWGTPPVGPSREAVPDDEEVERVHCPVDRSGGYFSEGGEAIEIYIDGSHV